MKRGERIFWAAPRQPSPDWGDQEEDVVVWVSVLALDAAWKLDNDNYIEPGGKGAAIDDRYQRFGKWLRQTADPVELPVVGVENGVVGFTDGRHRFAWLRDQRMSAIPVQVPSDQAREFERRFGTRLRTSVIPKTEHS